MTTPILYAPDRPGHWLRISPHGITDECVRPSKSGLTRPETLRFFVPCGPAVGTLQTWRTARFSLPGRWIFVSGNFIAVLWGLEDRSPEALNFQLAALGGLHY